MDKLQQHLPQCPSSLTCRCIWYCWSTSLQNSSSDFFPSLLCPFLPHRSLHYFILTPPYSLLPTHNVKFAQEVKTQFFSCLFIMFFWSIWTIDCNLISVAILFPTNLVPLFIMSKWILLTECLTNSLSSART